MISLLQVMTIGEREYKFAVLWVPLNLVLGTIWNFCRFLWPLMDMLLQFYRMSYSSVQYCAFNAHELKAVFFFFFTIFSLCLDWMWGFTKSCEDVITMPTCTCTVHMHVLVKIFFVREVWPQKVSFWWCILDFQLS